jgi:hypothetical protein
MSKCLRAEFSLAMIQCESGLKVRSTKQSTEQFALNFNFAQSPLISKQERHYRR